MNTYVYNIHGSEVSCADEADALRLCYLLADTVDALGSADDWFRQALEARTTDFKQRGVLFEQWLRDYGTSNPEELGKLLSDFDRLKKLNLTRGADRNFRRQLEKIMDKMFTAMRDEYFQKNDRKLLADLTGLLDEDVFGAAWIDAAQPEDDREGEACSTLLRLLFDRCEPGTNPVFCLPAPFAGTDAGRQWPAALPGQEARAGQGRVVLRMPTLRHCSAGELLKLRGDCRPLAEPFCRAMDRWTENRSAEVPEAVSSAAAALQSLLQNHPLLQAAEGGLELYAGILPVAALWTGLRQLRAVPDATWAVLAPLLPAAATGRPTLMTAATALSPVRSLAPELAVRLRKKSIAID